MSDENSNCFGFHSEGAAPCVPCLAKKRCRAITGTHGLDITAALLDQLLHDLPEGTYTNSDQVRTLVMQIKSPPPPPESPLLDEVLNQ